ncbi:MAG: ApaG domain [Akkermansiaceae bacterium]|nr:ApaG domain [Akkermansiaceae bacterium]
MSRPSRVCRLGLFGAWQFRDAGGSSRGMARVIQEMEGLRVMVDDIIYMPSLDAPADKPHPFVYFISIHNESPVPVTIRGRKWVVRDSEGDTTVVEGEGVVGQTPTIAPGEHFSYNSYHVVAGGGAEVSGAFFGETAVGDWIFARIPDFRLELPQ